MQQDHRSQVKIKNKTMTFTVTALVTSICLILTTPLAEAKKKNNTTKKSTKKTVGELLSQVSKADRGSNLKTEKLRTAIPGSELNFKKPPSNYNLEQVKPPHTSEILVTSEQPQEGLAEYEKILDQQIAELFKLTKKFKDSPNRGEYWLRLAELYVEKSMLIDGRQQEEFDRKLKAYNEGKTKKKPILNTTDAKAYNKKALQLYEWFQKDFPTDPKMAQALYFLGYNNFELGNEKKGAEFYQRLNKSYPGSPFIGESKFALGEYYFDNEKWSIAYEEYSTLIKDKRHQLHPFATYKGAWCLYRLGKFKDALKYMEYMIRSGRGENAATGEGRRVVNRNKLEAEAMRDIVVFYAAAGDPQKAPDYFRDLIGKDEWVYVEKLAYYSVDKGSKESTQELFKLLINREPMGPKAFEYQYQIVQSNFYSKNSPRFREELTRWIRDYGVSSQWAASNQANQELLNNAYKLREQTLRNWILQQHQTAQNSRTKTSQQSANEGYKLYLQEFPTSPTIADMHFYHGELLYDMGLYDEAGLEYKWVVDNAAQSKFADKAAQNLLHSVERSLPKDEEMLKRVGKNTDPIPLDPKSERFIVSAQSYLEKFPHSNKAQEIRFRMGRLYYQHNQFTEAKKIFQEIIKKGPKSKFTDYSANLILDIYNLQKDYIGLEKAGAEILASPTIAGTKAGDEIRSVIEKSNFKKAQTLENDKKYAESAVQYDLFAAQNPNSELAVMALFNAGINYERASQNDKAVAVYQKVVRSKDKDLRDKTKRLLAKLYQDAGLFEESARLYKESAEDSPKDPLAANFIFNAAVMYEALGKNQEALNNYKLFLEKSKRNSDKKEVHFTMAQIYRKMNQRSNAIEKYQEYLESYPADEENIVEAHYHLSQLNRKSDEVKEWKEKTIRVQRRLAQKRKGAGAHYAALLRLEQAQESFKNFRSANISTDPKRQKQTLDHKLGLLTQLNKDLSEVVKLDSAEEMVSSLSLIGEANLHMAHSILNAPVPKGLTPDEEKQYREGITKFAEPFNAKAKESFKLAVDRGFELEVYNTAFRSAYDYMAKYDPKTYYSYGEYGQDVRFVNWIGQ